MNYIIIDEKYISAFTNSINADTHKHYMLQLFISYNDNLDIEVKGEKISCKGIIVNTNVEHCFYSNNKTHFTMLIDTTSDLAEEFQKNYLIERDYFIFDSIKINSLQKFLNERVRSVDLDRYREFIYNLFSDLSIEIKERKNYDERINKLLKLLNESSHCFYSINEFAKILSLSESRLSHLFKEEIGISLKSYIVLCKLKKAYNYLLQSGNITDAAMKAGFDSPSHFAYTSKKLTGMSAKNISKDSVFLKVSNYKID